MTVEKLATPRTEQGRWLLDHQGLINVGRINPSMRGDEVDLRQCILTIETEAAALDAPAQPVHPEPLDVFVRETFMALRRRLVGVPPNVDGIDAAIGYALNDCEQAIVDVLFREASEPEGARE